MEKEENPNFMSLIIKSMDKSSGHCHYKKKNNTYNYTFIKHFSYHHPGQETYRQNALCEEDM